MENKEKNYEEKIEGDEEEKEEEEKENQLLARFLNSCSR